MKYHKPQLTEARAIPFQEVRQKVVIYLRRQLEDAEMNEDPRISDRLEADIGFVESATDYTGLATALMQGDYHEKESVLKVVNRFLQALAQEV